MHFIGEQAFEQALSSSGLRVSGSSGDARAHLSQLSYRVARRLVEMLRLVSDGKATVQPEHVLNLSKIAGLVGAPVGESAPRRRDIVMRGGGDTVMTGSFFNAQNAADASAYSHTAADDGHHESFPLTPGGGDIVRYELPSSFPAFGGGGSSARAAPSRHLISEEAIAAILREYKARSGSDIRFSEGARKLIRRIVDANAVAALHETASSAAKKTAAGRHRSVSAAALGKLSSKWVIRF